MFLAITLLTCSSISLISFEFNALGCEKSNLNFSSLTKEPYCSTCSPKTFLNIGFSGQNAMIRSAELGLESHPIGGWDEDKVKEISNIPSDSQVAFLLVIGKEGKIDMLSKELLEKHNKQRERNPLDINFNLDEWG